jgi:hypothetical protein
MHLGGPLWRSHTDLGFLFVCLQTTENCALKKDKVVASYTDKETRHLHIPLDGETSFHVDLLTATSHYTPPSIYIACLCHFHLFLDS